MPSHSSLPHLPPSITAQKASINRVASCAPQLHPAPVSIPSPPPASPLPCRGGTLSSSFIAFYKHHEVAATSCFFFLLLQISTSKRGCRTKIESQHPSWTSPPPSSPPRSSLFLPFLKWRLCDTPLSAPGNAQLRFHLGSLLISRLLHEGGRFLLSDHVFIKNTSVKFYDVLSLFLGLNIFKDTTRSDLWVYPTRRGSKSIDKNIRL